MSEDNTDLGWYHRFRKGEPPVLEFGHLERFYRSYGDREAAMKLFRPEELGPDYPLQLQIYLA